MADKKWVGPSWVSSPYNFAPGALGKQRFPKKLQLYDVTCRDGEQRPGVVFSKDDKVKIAQKLDEAGIQRIEAGMPAVSEEDFQAVHDIAHLGQKADVVAFSRARKDDIDLALKAGVSNILIEAPSSDPLIKIGFNWDKKKVLGMVLEATQYAKAHGLKTTFFAVDSARADPGFLRKLYTSAIKQSHVDSVAVVDTFGVTSPEGFAQLVKSVRRYVNVPIEVHCHNDFGLGTANAIAGLSAGASIAHTNVNGIGERAGGASTEEVAVALRVLYGKDLGFNFGKFYELSQLVQRVSGVPVSPQKPVVGETAFGYEAGIAVMFSYRFAHANALRYAVPYMPQLVGNKFSVTLGKKSGAMSIRWRLEELGYEGTDEQADKLLTKVKEMGVRLRRGLTDDEFTGLVNEVLGPKSSMKPVPQQ